MILTGLLIIVLLFILVMYGLSITSRFTGSHGLNRGRLARCPGITNCVCTENYENRNYDPIPFIDDDPIKSWANLKSVITSAGGEIKTDSSGYLWSIFITPVWRFVDDFEARLDTVNACIQLRSASRVGRYDFGTNLRRINLVTHLYMNSSSEMK